MVDPKKFKEHIKGLISQDYEIQFLGGREHFDDLVEKIAKTQAEEIYLWIERVLKKSIAPLYRATPKPYKQWQINELLSFRKELNIGNNEYRILFIKVKNDFYIEFHFGDHKYYDRLRKQLDLTKKSY